MAAAIARSCTNIGQQTRHEEDKCHAYSRRSRMLHCHCYAHVKHRQRTDKVNGVNGRFEIQDGTIGSGEGRKARTRSLGRMFPPYISVRPKSIIRLMWSMTLPRKTAA